MLFKLVRFTVVAIIFAAFASSALAAPPAKGKWQGDVSPGYTITVEVTEVGSRTATVRILRPGTRWKRYTYNVSGGTLTASSGALVITFNADGSVRFVGNVPGKLPFDGPLRPIP
jgi:hypothetical protein